MLTVSEKKLEPLSEERRVSESEYEFAVAKVVSFANSAIEEAFESSDIWQELSSESPEIYAEIKEFVLSGGKRLRPVLFYLFYRAFTNEFDTERLKRTMAAMEVIHAFILIHDDVIDKSLERRSSGTLNIRFQKLLLSAMSFNSPADGRDLAIVAGDMLYAFAVDIFTHGNFPPELLNTILSRLSKTALMTAHGEFRELLATYKSFDNVTETEVLRIYDLKTSYYTFFGPVWIAVILSNYQIEEKAIEEITLNLGKAFQIHNDIKELKESSSTDKIPKDFMEKKRTLPLIWAYSSADAEERKTIEGFINSEQVTFGEYLKVKDIFARRDIIRRAEEEIESYKNRAIGEIMRLRADANYISLIIKFINNILK